jgi:hypothetical protein
VQVRVDSVHYRLVYDAAAAGYTDWWFPAAGMAMLLVVTALLYRHRRRREPARGAWMLYFGVPFLTLWVVVAGVGTYHQYARLRDALRSGQFTMVEGVVRGFQPSDPGDHQEERWEVESRGVIYRYHYVPSNLSPGFRQTRIHGGPIRDGLRVRIADVDGYIARLEVAQ